MGNRCKPIRESRTREEDKYREKYKDKTTLTIFTSHAIYLLRTDSFRRSMRGYRKARTKDHRSLKYLDNLLPYLSLLTEKSSTVILFPLDRMCDSKTYNISHISFCHFQLAYQLIFSSLISPGIYDIPVLSLPIHFLSIYTIPSSL